jgi:hypothetical protein
MPQNTSIQAFCCNCKEVTKHNLTYFGTHTNKPTGLFNKILTVISESVSESPSSDYKCSKCGTYLTTPDNLD